MQTKIVDNNSISCIQEDSDDLWRLLRGLRNHGPLPGPAGRGTHGACGLPRQEGRGTHQDGHP